MTAIEARWPPSASVSARQTQVGGFDLTADPDCPQRMADSASPPSSKRRTAANPIGRSRMRRASPTSTTPIALRSTSRHRARHEIRHRSPARRPRAARAAGGQARRAARASRLGDARTSRIRSTRWPRCAGSTSRAAFGPQHGAARRHAGQYDGVARLHRPALRHPGVQPVRRGAPADRRSRWARSTCCWSTCRTSAAASTPSSRRCSTCSRRRRQHGKAVWVLDRPNPAGRPVEGLTLLPGWESFVGAGPMPMRHGLTLGELGHWFIAHASSSTSSTA